MRTSSAACARSDDVGDIGRALAVDRRLRMLPWRLASSSVTPPPSRHGPCAQLRAGFQAAMQRLRRRTGRCRSKNVRLQKSMLVIGRLMSNSASCQASACVSTLDAEFQLPGLQRRQRLARVGIDQRGCWAPTCDSTPCPVARVGSHVRAELVARGQPWRGEVWRRSGGAVGQHALAIAAACGAGPARWSTARSTGSRRAANSSMERSSRSCYRRPASGLRARRPCPSTLPMPTKLKACGWKRLRSLAGEQAQRQVMGDATGRRVCP